MRIGIDIGGVVIGGTGNDTSFFSDDYLMTPAVPGVTPSLRLLNSVHDLYFISKAFPKTAKKTLCWLHENSVFWKAHIDTDRLVFCRNREDKAAIARLLELDVFIDDRQDVCDTMVEAGITPILFSDWESTLDKVSQIRKKRRNDTRTRNS